MHYYLVATYNHGAFVEAMVDSIRLQYGSTEGFLREARLLVLDDASSDATRERLAALARRHGNIGLLANRQNRGIGFNRNLLLDWLRRRQPREGDFAQFVDGDDLLAAGSLTARLRAFALEPSLQAVGGQLGLFSGMDDARLRPVTSFATDPRIEAIANIFECHFYIANTLFRAEALLDPQMRFPTVNLSEDWLFFALHPLRKRHVGEITLKYRQHGGNLTCRIAQAQVVFTVRRQAHSLALLRIAMLPSARECELLDLVGYLSLRMVWQGGRPDYRPDIRMPWFRPLARRPDIASRWESLRRELGALFTRIIDNNDRVGHFDPDLLRTYCDALLQFAGRELGQALAEGQRVRGSE